uniref:EF-hand domain (C-terminal) containing 2 n=1 Tax=Salarias fasciatus TaxID=181472 RepID=A0A672ICX8_SALFA
VSTGRNRIRKCKIYFYLEDDTIQVVEPEYKNSGIPQGTLICRQRIPLPPPNQERFYNIFHFNINHQVVLFSRTFTVTNCDTFTRDFLRRQGVLLNAPAEAPADPYCSLRQQPLRPYERHDTLRQFLDHDGKVLRFYCLWDDTESAFGERRELVLHYFLSDDTIEILEVVPPNSGRDAPPRFLQRSRLPKNHQKNNQNNPNLKDQQEDDFYQDCDLTVGGELNVWGRRVILTDCDDFTKHYYRSKYGIETRTSPPRPVPPYNGFGSEEDSLSSCRGLLPKPPRKDFHKFMENDRVLNFLAKMATTDPVDQERLFHVSYHLCDDTISVFERPQKNSGVIGGKFLLRCRVKKPGQDLFKSELSEYFTAPDLYVGATLCLGGRSFRILEADEFTLNYMQQRADEVRSQASVFRARAGPGPDAGRGPRPPPEEPLRAVPPPGPGVHTPRPREVSPRCHRPAPPRAAPRRPAPPRAAPRRPAPPHAAPRRHRGVSAGIKIQFQTETSHHDL